LACDLKLNNGSALANQSKLFILLNWPVGIDEQLGKGAIARQ
jgi:hypothetical protein